MNGSGDDSRHTVGELELTFFEEESAKERGAMDADGDRLISTAEKESYLARLAPTLGRSVLLHVAGREVALTPLYDPELDLLANNKTGPGHHCLRLFLFASTPPNLRGGDELVIEDRLWPEAGSLGTMHTEGRDGWRPEAESSLGQTTTKSDSRSQSFSAKYLITSGKKTTSPEATVVKATGEAPGSRVQFADPGGSSTK